MHSEPADAGHLTHAVTAVRRDITADSCEQVVEALQRTLLLEYCRRITTCGVTRDRNL